MVSYFDASAFVKLVGSSEPGRDAVRALWTEATAVASSTLAYAEVCAGLGAAERDGRLRRTERLAAVEQWNSYWDETDAIEVTEDVARRAGQLAPLHSLRSGDAVHLASALTFGDVSVRFVAWDQRLRAAAASVGLSLAPANIEA